MSEDSSDRKQFGRCLEIYGISRYGFRGHICVAAKLSSAAMKRVRWTKWRCSSERNTASGTHTRTFSGKMASPTRSTPLESACESEQLLGGH